jgi:hypothetical protein
MQLHTVVRISYPNHAFSKIEGFQTKQNLCLFAKLQQKQERCLHHHFLPLPLPFLLLFALGLPS